MCLAIPMRIKSINGEFAQVETGRLKHNINIQLLSSLKIGDYVIVHAGFAIKKLDPEKAKETLRLLDEIR
jgi:hydrogenase expression/formation protein HypC